MAKPLFFMIKFLLLGSISKFQQNLFTSLLCFGKEYVFFAKTFTSWKNLYLKMAKSLPLVKTFISS